MAQTTMRWVTRQILSIRRVTVEPASLRVMPPNPRPKGEPTSAGASFAVRAWLAKRPPRGWWTRAQIVAGTNCTERAVDWALAYLCSISVVESAHGDMRNSRYKRYRIKSGA